MPDRRPVGKLGRLPGKVPVGLRDLTFYAAGSLPKAPATVTPPDVSDWEMLGNDQYGDCGVAGLEHVFMADAMIAGESEEFPSAQEAISYYLAYTGGQDTGVVLSDYLAHVRAAGYYHHTIDSFAPVAVHDVPTLRFAVWAYGAAYCGIVVTATMQESFANHRPWQVATLDGPVEGGHCVPIVGFNDHAVQIVTWGAIQEITYPAWHLMSSEAWAVVTGEAVDHGGDGRGVTLAALRADLDRLAT